MIRRFALLIVAIVALSALAWWLVDDSASAPAPKPKPSQVDKIIEFCSKPTNADAPLCTIDAKDPDAVKNAVKDALTRQTTGPQIIERERITDSDSDDSDSDAPDVRVVAPTPAPTAAPSTPTPTRTTQPPLVRDIEIPELPAVPEVQIPDLPPLPLP